MKLIIDFDVTVEDRDGKKFAAILYAAEHDGFRVEQLEDKAMSAYAEDGLTEETMHPFLKRLMKRARDKKSP